MSTRLQLQAKNLKRDRVLKAIAEVNNSGRWANTSDLYRRFPEFPEKVVLAKLSKLVRRGFIDGCACGCSGGFTILPKAMAWV